MANIPAGDTVLAVSHFGGQLAVGSSAVHVLDSSDPSPRMGGTLALQMGDPRVRHIEHGCLVRDDVSPCSSVPLHLDLTGPSSTAGSLCPVWGADCGRY